MAITHIKDLAEFNKFIANNVTFVVDFFANWCGPCKMIAPKYEELSAKFTNVQFLKVNVDECQDVASFCAIRSMPTFLFYKNGKKVSEVIGADSNALENKLKEL